MKKLSLVLILIGVSGLILMVQPATAQWTQNGDLLYNTNQSSQIGIGTTNPISRLHVEGKGGANLFKVRNYLGQTQVTVSNNGYMGLGTWDPQYALDVYEGHMALSNNYDLLFEDSTGAYSTGIRMSTSDNLYLINGASGGSVYIGVENLSSIWVKNNHDIYLYSLAIQGNGAVYANGGVLTMTDPSSRDYKKDIQPIDLKAERVLKLEPKSYTWKENGKEDFGYIAEEIKEILPELYRENSSTKGYASDKLRLYIIEVLKKQEDRIVGLEAEIKTLKAELETGK